MCDSPTAHIGTQSVIKLLISGIHIPYTQTCVVFFLWSMLKDKVYVTNLCTAEQLKENIGMSLNTSHQLHGILWNVLPRFKVR